MTQGAEQRGRAARGPWRAVVGIVAVAAVALAGCSAVPPGLTPSVDSGPSPIMLDETPRALAGGWQVLAAGDKVLDRAANAYVPGKLPPNSLLDPTGLRYLEQNGPWRVVSVAGGDGVTVAGQTEAGRAFMIGRVDPWSPRGDRFVGTIHRKNPYGLGFTIVDPATGKTVEHWIDHARYDCSQCSFVFTRDGREVAMAIANRSGGEGAELVASVQLFDAATGAATRNLAIKAMPLSPFAWSPDGRQVIATPDALKPDHQIVDTATGAAKPFPSAAVFATDGLLLAWGSSGVLTLRPDGSTAERAVLPPSLAGDVRLGPPAA